MLSYFNIFDVYNAIVFVKSSDITNEFLRIYGGSSLVHQMCIIIKNNLKNTEMLTLNNYQTSPYYGDRTTFVNTESIVFPVIEYIYYLSGIVLLSYFSILKNEQLL